MTEMCDLCGAPISGAERILGWPIPILDLRAGDPTQDHVYVGPCCGDGYGSEGEVLAAEEEDES